jgi:serine/threonine-protein kinase
LGLTGGTRLGSYEIVSPLGAGGMGEVYRARDNKLGRQVALKVIPDAFAMDPERLARFEREAQLLASLNHPNIAALYGLEESQGTRALVMELVEGDTLAERLAHGPLPLDEAVACARQIAEALEYAHEHGVVHRDLKPANIKLLPDGTAKVLDFGLAKAQAADNAGGSPVSSPTLTAAATKMGMIIGTAAYMSPEQAKGRAVDRRSDIWSFGCVLYEMMAGKLAFQGETVTDTLAAVVRGEPDWILLPATTPVTLRRLIERCLRKDLKNRLQAIGDARIALEECLSGETAVPPPAAAAIAPRPRSALFMAVPWALAVVLALLSLLIWRPWKVSPAPQVVRLTADLGVEGDLYTAYGASAVLSPDATRIAYVVVDGNRVRHLWWRSLDEAKPKLLPGTDGARDPFFSPDGRWIGFFAENQLKKLAVEDGAIVSLCTITDDRGGAWGEDNTIIFAPQTRTSLMWIPAGGGTPTAISKLQGNEVTHRWPQFLPGGKVIIYTASDDGNNYENSNIIAQVIATGERKILYHGGYAPHYLPGGYLVFVHQGTLFGMRFDPGKLEVRSQPVPIVGGIVSAFGSAGSQMSFSNSGMAAYMAGNVNTSELFDVEWLNSRGKSSPLASAPKTYWALAFSPNGNLLALGIEEGGSQDILVDDYKRDVITRLTFGSPSNMYPEWTPDGKYVSFATDEPGAKFSLSWKRADGGGEKQVLLEDALRFGPVTWSPDRKSTVFTRITHGGAASDLFRATLEGNDKAGWKLGSIQPFVTATGLQTQPAFSPDGKWVAYQSNETGTWEIFVRPFPGPGGRWQVSQGGGFFPHWSAATHELFFENNEKQLMTAKYAATADTFSPSTPQMWSSVNLGVRGPVNTNFTVHPDGTRVAVLRDYSPTGKHEPMRITYVFNFTREVEEKLAGTVGK